MFRRFMSIFSILFCTTYAKAAQIANVEYVHRTILHRWGVDIAYNEKLNSTNQVANMKYLMTAIDIANRILNGDDTTNYADGDFATQQAIDSVAVDTAIDTLISQSPFEIRMTNIDTSFEHNITISAMGDFTIDWGDGTIDKIVRTDTIPQMYAHTYSANDATIKLYGRATAYSDDETTSTVMIRTKSKVGSVNISAPAPGPIELYGSIGRIFPTLPSGKQPRFIDTFVGMALRNIPENLFAGVYGQPVSHMFEGTFSASFLGNPNISWTIPANLFSKICGQPAPFMFARTFRGSKSTGETIIPAGLFSCIRGVPTESMFDRTFETVFNRPTKATGPHTEVCTVQIPDNLFDGISGAPATNMFRGTFTGLCAPLNVYSQRINGEFLYNIWPEEHDKYFRSMYFPYYGWRSYKDAATIPSSLTTYPNWPA